MPRTRRLFDWVLASAVAVGAAAAAPHAGAQTGFESGVERPTRIVPAREARCRPSLTCWFDHWGYRRCFRRWVCTEDRAPDLRRFPPRRRFSLEEDYAPESGFRRYREPSWRRYREWEEPGSPEVVRPDRRSVPPVPRQPQVTARPRLKDVPNGETTDNPETEVRKPSDTEAESRKPSDADRPTEPETALRRDEPRTPPTKPEAEPEVEVIPRPVPAPPEKESARLKEPPPAPARPATESPAPVKLAPKLEPKPEPAPPQAKPDRRSRSDEVPDDIDKLPRGRKIPMDEIDPPKSKKKLRERMPI